MELGHPSALQMGLALGWDWPMTLKAVHAVAAQVFEQDANKVLWFHYLKHHLCYALLHRVCLCNQLVLNEDIICHS